MNTIIEKQQRFGTGLSRCFWAFCALLVCLSPATNVYAVPHEHEIQVDFSFDTQALPDKQVSGYRLYRENEPVCDPDPGPLEPQSIACMVVGEDGTYDFTLSALYDDGSESPQSAPFTFTIVSHEPTPVAPTISVNILISSLAENTDTSATIKVAEIIITDDDQGTNNLSLVGPDAALFTIIGSELFLRAGAALDFETNASLNVTVEVDDPSLPATPEDSAAIAISISDVDEPANVLNAVITTDSPEGEAPFTLTLSGSTSTGTISGYSWSFGDGGSATTVSPTHTYLSPGAYTATLTVSASDGATHTDSITIVVTEPPVPPTAVISSSNPIGEAPLVVHFDGSGSITNDQLTATYTWDFGDNSGASGVTASHTFTTPETCMVTLTVTDSLGLTDQASTPVIISEPEAENQPPVSSFTATPSSEIPLTFMFDASNSSDPDGHVTSYLWSFGDGSYAELMSPEHTFSEVGDYTVVLQVTDDEGEMTESSQTVLVSAEEDVSFYFELGEVEVGNDWVLFTVSEPFLDPVVIAGPPSFVDAEPTTIRIRNVTQNGFEVRVQEWDYLDNRHAPETFSFIVMEKGVYTLESGAKIEVGSFSTSSTRFKRFYTQETFDNVPVILTQVMTDNENDAVTVRLRSIGNQSFDYKLQEQESNRKSHSTETIGYIAWEPGSGEISGLFYETGFTTQSVTHRWFDLTFQTEMPDLPLFFAGMQTSAGGNTAVVRSQNISGTIARINIEEEQSKDTEVTHSAAEIVGYLAIGATNATQE